MAFVLRITAALWLLAPLACLAQSEPEPVPGAIIVEGASAFSQREFFPLYRDLLGEPLTRQRRDRLQQQIVTLYRDRGFAAPAVDITRDDRSSQVVNVSINEPVVTAVAVRGFGDSEAALLRRMARPAVNYRGPLSGSQLAALVQNMEQRLDRPVTVDLEQQANTDARYTLVVSPRRQLGGSITYSLEGSDRLGRQLVYARLALDNPAKYASEAYLSALHTLNSDGFRTLGAGVTLAPAAAHRVDLSASLARARPRDTASEQVYNRQRYRLGWRHGLIRDDGREMTLLSSFTVRDYTFDIDSRERVDERLRVAGLGLDNRWLWRGRSLSLEVTGRQGLDSLGAQREGPGAVQQTDLDFTLVQTRATLRQALPAGLSFRLDLDGQYSRDRLPFSERFSIGGYRYARAYEPGEFTGDRGIGSKLEVRRGFALPSLGHTRLVPYAYYGVARTFDNQRSERQSAAAAGAGVRLLGERIYAYLEVGKPLTAVSDYREDEPRVTGRLTLRLP